MDVHRQHLCHMVPARQCLHILGIHAVDGFAQLSTTLLIDAASIDPDVRQVLLKCLYAETLDLLVTNSIRMLMQLFQTTER